VSNWPFPLQSRMPSVKHSFQMPCGILEIWQRVFCDFLLKAEERLQAQHQGDTQKHKQGHSRPRLAIDLGDQV